ncbi:MAG TPA: SEC-C domain-containing protein, partial [Flavobacterium sp.]|nr:SEC-C domain-containing protein [Flavobacterium sp.]
LEAVLSNADLTRNKLCPCGSGVKIKKCHESAIEIIKCLGREKITSDLLGIRKWISEQLV